ncbi:hypothetical protein GQ53DRAFT_831969 [Thozetella sp. PMI_491]|nr:hypothetical protein GQ53DRAFT_831969 [Thozetella sp. PMI_491]
MSTPQAAERSVDLQTSWGDFRDLVQQILNTSSYKFMDNICNENERLRHATEREKKIREGNEEQISDLVGKEKIYRETIANKDSKIDKLQKTLTEAEQTVQDAKKNSMTQANHLKAKDDEIKRITDTFKTLEVKNIKLQGSVDEKDKKLQELEKMVAVLRGEKDSAETVLAEKSARLQKIEGWISPLEDHKNGDVVVISMKQLNRLFEIAHDLTRSYFSGDLADDMLGDDRKWTKLTKSDVFPNGSGIPIPQSNSPHAKQMRIAAVLAVIAHNFSNIIFQPLHGLDNGEELYELLSDIAEEDPDKEAFLRSALLSAFDSAGDGARQQHSVEQAYDGIYASVGHLVQDKEQKKFRENLAELCQFSCKTWCGVQRLEVKIESTMEIDEGEWDPLKSHSMTKETTANLNGKDGGQTAQSLKATSTSKEKGATTGSQRSNRPTAEVVMVTIWPCFFYVRKGRLELIYKGYGLGSEHINVARSEIQSSSRNSSTDVWREKRKRSRATSNAGAIGKNVKSFLSQNGSTGSAGD